MLSDFDRDEAWDNIPVKALFSLQDVVFIWHWSVLASIWNTMSGPWCQWHWSGLKHCLLNPPWISNLCVFLQSLICCGEGKMFHVICAAGMDKTDLRRVKHGPAPCHFCSPGNPLCLIVSVVINLLFFKRVLGQCLYKPHISERSLERTWVPTILLKIWYINTILLI